MTPDELDALEAAHIAEPVYEPGNDGPVFVVNRCQIDHQEWPCEYLDLIAAARERDVLQTEWNGWKAQFYKAKEREARLRAALERIAAMDYRGNVPQATVMARAALSQEATDASD
jgi:hypothetical protein